MNNKIKTFLVVFYLLGISGNERGKLDPAVLVAHALTYADPAVIQ